MKMRIHVASTVGGGASSQFESLNDEIKLTNTCGEVLEKVARKIGIADLDSLQLRFNGQQIPKNIPLNAFNDACIQEHHILIVTKIAKDPPPPVIPFHRSNAIRNEFRMWHSSRNRMGILLNKMWQHESTARLVMEIPCLRDDVNGMRLLRDPINLRRHIFDKDKFQALTTEHPGVVLAVEMTLKSLQTTGSQLTSILASGYESEEEEDGQQPMDIEQNQIPRLIPIPRAPVGGAPNQRAITAQQLAAAIAGLDANRSPLVPATPAPTPQRHTSQLDLSGVSLQQQQQQAQASTSGTGRGGAITAEMLQSAVMNALMAGSSSSSSPRGATNAPIQDHSPPTPAELELLSQLSAMGFADAAMNLRALRTCAGNLEMTLDMLIAQREAFALD